jgi:RND superfamily putative drug exporter
VPNEFLSQARQTLIRLYSRRLALVWVILWGGLACCLGPTAWNFSHRLQGTLTGVDNSAAESVRVALTKNFTTALAFPTAIIWDSHGLTEETAQGIWARIVESAKNSPGVTQVYDGKALLPDWPRPDWHAAFIELGADSYGQAEKMIPVVRAQIKRDAGAPPGRPVWITGGPALFFDLNVASVDALRRAELMALPVTFLILLVVFRSVVAAFLPVLVAGLGVLVSLGALSYLSTLWPMTFFVPNLVNMIGLGVGIDYSLIYLARYRRERDQHLTVLEALDVTRHTAGHTVLVSAGLVMTGFLALLVIPINFFHSIALGGILVVGSVAAATLTFMPAAIFLLGHGLEFGSVFQTDHQMSQKVRDTYRIWTRLLLYYPEYFFLAGTSILVLLGLPIRQLTVTSLQASTLPTRAESRLGYESLHKEIGQGWMMPTIILEQHGAEGSEMGPEMIAQEKELITRIKRLENTGRIISLATPPEDPGQRREQTGLLTGSPESGQTILLAISHEDPQSPAGRRWLHQLDGVLREQHESFPNGASYMIGGVAATTTATDEVIFAALPKVIMLTLITTFFLLTYYMKSILVPLKAIVLNLFCVLAVYGFQVLWFQLGVGHSMLGVFPQTDGLNTIVLVICFCALFGLSMDYEVFILSAIRESWLDQHHFKIAIEEGLEKTSGIITSAALIMVSVFLCFAFGSVVETQQIGMGLSFAVFLDATLVRLVLAPSVLALMGKWAWWMPGRPMPGTERKRDMDH